jgi:hypothetical protein
MGVPQEAISLVRSSGTPLPRSVLWWSRGRIDGRLLFGPNRGSGAARGVASVGLVAGSAQLLTVDEPQRLCRREDGDALEAFEGE